MIPLLGLRKPEIVSPGSGQQQLASLTTACGTSLAAFPPFVWCPFLTGSVSGFISPRFCRRGARCSSTAPTGRSSRPSATYRSSVVLYFLFVLKRERPSSRTTLTPHTPAAFNPRSRPSRPRSSFHPPPICFNSRQLLPP